MSIGWLPNTMFGMLDAGVHTSPLDDGRKVLAALHSEGLFLVLPDVAATLIYASGESIELKGSVQLYLTSRRLEGSVTFGADYPKHANPQFIQVRGEDTHGDSYDLQLYPTSFAGGADKAALRGTIPIIVGRRKLPYLVAKQRTTIDIPFNLVLPFSSTTEVLKLFKGTKIARNAQYEGYYGERADGMKLDISPRESWAELTLVYPDQSLEAERLIDAVTCAASYVLGVALEPFYLAADRGYDRTIILRKREPRKLLDQSASPIAGDLRTASEKFFYLFCLALAHCAEQVDDRRSREMGAMLNVYITFDDRYLHIRLLHLCIAIEGLLRLTSKLEPADLLDKVEREMLRKAVDESGLVDAKISRVHALLSQLNSPSVSYLFAKLIDKKVIRKEHQDAFKRHRSVLAHGGDLDGKVNQIIHDQALLLECFHILLQSRLEAPVVA